MFVEDEKTGKITALMYAKGYGFVEETGGGNSFFFHAQHTRDFELLEVGDKVVFFTRMGETYNDVEGNEKQNMNAVRVRSV